MSPGVRQRTLILLTSIYAFSFIDRVVIALVAQDMKADLGISDFEIGLLGGSAFAFVNTLATLPVARLAERYRRKTIIGISIVAGSAFTMMCGVAGSFGQFLVLRMGMALGSAGTEAPAHSVISDMYERERRASAIAIFSLGVPLASIIGAYVGGYVGELHGWRATFLVFGAPGLLLGIAGLFLMREPAREEAPAGAGPASLPTVMKLLWGKGQFRHLLAGASLMSFASFGINTFLPAFMVRNYEVSAGGAGLMFGLIVGIASAIGTLLGGFGAERLARRDPRWLLRTPAIGFVAGVPLMMIGLTQATSSIGVGFIFFASLFFYTWMGPSIAATHGLLGTRMRASGSALFLLVVYLVGQGFGPPVLGFLSDRIAAHQYAAGDFGRACVGAAAEVPGSACAVASADGIRFALMLFTLVFLWAALHFFFASRRRATTRLDSKQPDSEIVLIQGGL